MYKIKIENLETGKVEADEVVDCIIAVTNIPDENRTHSIAAAVATPTVIRAVLNDVRELCKCVKAGL